MSRSYHATIRSLEELARWNFSDKTEKTKHLDEVSEKLRQKRKVKATNLKWRRSPDDYLSTNISTLPINVSKEGEYDHHSITEQDVRTILSMLPAGTVDGLTSIDLCLGKEHQDIEENDPDPLTGRFGSEFVAGIFSGECYGCYYPASGRIFVFNWVYAPDNKIATLLAPYLKLYSLGTLVHEVAHHFDTANRLNHPRWSVRDLSSKEMYAESMEYIWIQELVTEYLMKTHPNECKQLLDWVSEYGGIELTLADLAPECRSTTKGKGDGVSDRAFFSLHQGFLEMVENYAANESVESCRRSFALWLATSDHYAEALYVNKKFLLANPQDIFALIEKVRIYRLLGQYDSARQIGTNLLEWAPKSTEALEALCRVEASAKSWNNLLKLAINLQDCTVYGSHEWLTACSFLGKAYAGLNRWEEFEAICQLLTEIDAHHNEYRIKALRRFAESSKKTQNGC